jgi:hypothetical protein
MTKPIDTQVLEHPLVKHLLESLPEADRDNARKTIVEMVAAMTKSLPTTLASVTAVPTKDKVE